jgi:hypothetical protein
MVCLLLGTRDTRRESESQSPDIGIVMVVVVSDLFHVCQLIPRMWYN